MKKIVYLIFGLIIIGNGISYNCVYAQQKMSKKERIIASQIPESVLSAISTEELLDRCLEYPYLSDIFFAQNIPLMFPHIVIEFNGLTEFFTKRPDAANVLLNKFKNLDVNNAENKSTDAEKGLFAFKFYYLSLFLAQDDILKQFKGSEKSILQELLKKYEGMINYNRFHNDMVYDRIAMSFIGYSLARNLNATGFKRFEALKNSNDKIKKILEQFNIQILGSELFSKIIDLTKDYIQQK
ncbi:MAG: hypothetical protein KAV45_05705 [Calditrichia bacterium]|jgi:hypothetical protein|nr:hypothetical protein [Calditrichia bacterium]